MKRDKQLTPDYTPEEATDILWTLLSLRNWEQWTKTCGWSHDDYTKRMQAMARRLFVIEKKCGR